MCADEYLFCNCCTSSLKHIEIINVIGHDPGSKKRFSYSAKILIRIPYIRLSLCLSKSRHFASIQFAKISYIDITQIGEYLSCWIMEPI